MKLYLIRHAESEANAASDLDNPTYYYDARITQRGVEQAKKLNNRIKIKSKYLILSNLS